MITEINVPNFVYKVKEEILEDYDDELYGVTKRDKLLIKVNSCLPKDLKKQTLIHELLHALELNSSIKYCSEAQIEQLSHGLLFVIKNNPELIRWLVE